MGAVCSVSPTKTHTVTRVESIDIQPTVNRKQETDPATQNGSLAAGTKSQSDTFCQQREGLKSDSGFQDAPNLNSVPSIHLEDYNEMNGKDTAVLSDVGSEDLVDPSLNIGDTEKKIERSRRTSKMENEAVTKQKLSLRRMKSQDTEQGKSQLADSSLEISPTAVDDTIDPSLNINEVEEKLTKTRRVSHSSYQQRLSLKKESLKKKTSLEERSEINQPTAAATS